MEVQKFAHKVDENVLHVEWCTKYRYRMFGQEKYKKLCEEILRGIAQKHGFTIRELSFMPEHVHIIAELPKWMSQSRALMLFKGECSYQLFRTNEHFRMRYPKRTLF